MRSSINKVNLRIKALLLFLILHARLHRAILSRDKSCDKIAAKLLSISSMFEFAATRLRSVALQIAVKSPAVHTRDLLSP